MIVKVSKEHSELVGMRSFERGIVCVHTPVLLERVRVPFFKLFVLFLGILEFFPRFVTGTSGIQCTNWVVTF